MNKISIIMELVMVVATASALAVNSVNAVSATSQVDTAQNITCDLACQEAIIDEADSDDIVDRMMEECGLLQPNMNATAVECTDRILAENTTGNG
jgi:prophage DNA circulation protein